VKKIKILYLIPSLGSGGTEKHLYQLVKYLDNNAYEIFVICLSNSDNSYVYDKYLEDIDVKVQYFSMADKLNIFHIIKFINSEEIDIIHSLSYSAIVYDMILYLFSSAEKFITVRRNMQHHRGGIKKLKWFEKIRNYFTSLILSNSYEAGNFAIELENFSPDKLKVIYNGIELNTNYELGKIEDIKQKINYNENDFIISNIANIKPVKRQEDLVKLMGLLKSENLNYKLVLIGREDNGYGQVIRNLINDLGLEEKVYILPFIDNVDNLLSITDVMIMSSSAEGFSNAILEAYKCKIPVVATAVGGNKEIVNEQLLYGVGDVDSLSKIVRSLSEDKLKEEKINIENKIIKFSLGNMIKEYEKLYREVIK
jgi:glycosyltransferase involved in cell wall biosynthesis